jgi:hypothetical protein
VPSPDGSDELKPKTLVAATVDQLLYYAHLRRTTGDSICLF